MRRPLLAQVATKLGPGSGEPRCGCPRPLPAAHAVHQILDHRARRWERAARCRCLCSRRQPRRGRRPPNHTIRATVLRTETAAEDDQRRRDAERGHASGALASRQTEQRRWPSPRARSMPRHDARDARAETKASLGPRVSRVSPFANLETRRVVSRSAPFPISAELRFGMSPGAVPTPTSARDGAC